MKSESIKELATAMNLAQSQIKRAVKDSDNPFFESKYADLSSVVEAIQDALTANGLSYVQISHDAETSAKIETMILHKSGEWLSCGITSVPVSKKDAHGYGSAMTYARRYSLSAAFGVAPDDDDGNASVKAKPDKALASAHKPTDGAWEALTPDEQTWILDLSNEVRTLLSRGDVKGACDHVDESGIDNDQRTALWSRLSDVSAGRRAMKEEWAARLKSNRKEA